MLQTLWERTAKPLGICDAVPWWEVQDAGKGTHLRRVEVCRAGRWGRLGGSALDLPGGGQGCAGVTLPLAPPLGAAGSHPRPSQHARVPQSLAGSRSWALAPGTSRVPGGGRRAAERPRAGSAGRGSAPTPVREVWMDNPSPCYFFPLM